MQDTTIYLDYLPDIRQNFANSDSISSKPIPQPRVAIVRHSQITDHINGVSHSKATDSLHQQATKIQHAATPQAWPPWIKYLCLVVITIVLLVIGVVLGYLFKALNF